MYEHYQSILPSCYLHIWQHNAHVQDMSDMWCLSQVRTAVLFLLWTRAQLT